MSKISSATDLLVSLVTLDLCADIFSLLKNVDSFFVFFECLEKNLSLHLDLTLDALFIDRKHFMCLWKLNGWVQFNRYLWLYLL